MRYVMCISNEGYEVSLVPRKVYQVVDDAWGEQHGMVRVIDESGEDYLFEVDRFVPVELSPAAAEAFARAPV